MPQFTLAIPTYRRFSLLKSHLQRYIDSPHVAEIVISDDCSEDYKLLQESYGNIAKLKIFTNLVNLGASGNKMLAVERSSSDFVFLLDSDNSIDDNNLKFLRELLVPPNTIICPSHGQPSPALDYSDLPNYISHLEFNLNGKYQCFANTGNYLVPRKEYCLAAQQVKESKVDPGPYDVVFINYHLGKMGLIFNNNKQFKYFHLVHDGGLWKTTHDKYDTWFAQFTNSLQKEYAEITNPFDDLKWRPYCDMVYPPFKNGLYLEEYFYRFYQLNKARFPRNVKYIDILWTNIYCNGLFRGRGYSAENLQKYIDIQFPEVDLKDSKSADTIKYFTIVQYDDGVLRKLPPNTEIFSAGGVGTIPLPLIYEDKTSRFNKIAKIPFAEKKHLCSFVGGFTHPLRNRMQNALATSRNILIFDRKIPEEFIEITRNSKFTLSPRGYGRSSFRFFEAYQLGSIPIYVYDDVNWLPFQDTIDYSKIAIVIRETELSQLEAQLSKITQPEYEKMWQEYSKISHLFTLEGMCEKILQMLSK